MSGVIIEPFTSVEAAERNFARLNEAIVAIQGGSIAIENIEGYENLATKLDLDEAIKKIQYKIGDIHISEKETNPAEKFGYGTWQLSGAGRAIIGHGETTDSRGEKKAFETGQTGGEFNHVLTVNEIPSHNHQAYDVFTSGGGGGYDSGPGHNPRTITTTNTGGGQPHNTMQPYIVYYIWKRTA